MERIPDKKKRFKNYVREIAREHIKLEGAEDILESSTDTYVILLFLVDIFDDFEEKFVTDIPESFVKEIIGYIDNYFRSYGGFTARESRNEIATVIQDCDMMEGQMILKKFVRDFGKKAIPNIQSNIKIKMPGEKITVSFYAALAVGKPTIEIDSVKEFASFSYKEINRIIL